MTIKTKKNLEKYTNQILTTTHEYLLKTLSENKIEAPKLNNFENYVKELTKFRKESNK